MNILAFILAVVAFGVFIFESLKTRPVGLLPLGLAILTAAWVVQTIWVTEHLVRIL